MDEKRRAKIQAAAQGFLEPDERVTNEVAGIGARGMWQIVIMLGPVGLMLFRRGRDYIATDRNIYVCRTSSLTGLPKKVLAKRPLTDGRLELTRTGLALDGANQLYIGRLGRRKARDFAEHAHASAATAGQPGGARPVSAE
jgi:hypothetical protein